jgi:peptidoglycan/xylan/chitin deacetylase (PgdA/CDA1 family)
LEIRVLRAILTFHSIDDSGSVLSFDGRLLDDLLNYLRKAAIPVHFLDDLLADDQPDGVAITFDDGARSIYETALPILNKYQVPAHLFLAAGVIGRDATWPCPVAGAPGPEMLNWDEVEALHTAGIRIENHTCNHPDMRKLSSGQMADECDQADEIIVSRLGRKPRYFAYPFGYYNESVCEVTRNRFSASLTTDLRMLGEDEDNAALPRLDSYYFRSRPLIGAFDSTAMRFYLKFRNILRQVKSRIHSAKSKGYHE